MTRRVILSPVCSETTKSNYEKTIEPVNHGETAFWGGSSMPVKDGATWSRFSKYFDLMNPGTFDKLSGLVQPDGDIMLFVRDNTVMSGMKIFHKEQNISFANMVGWQSDQNIIYDLIVYGQKVKMPRIPNILGLTRSESNKIQLTYMVSEAKHDEFWNYYGSWFK